jgi:uncharacterized protein
MNKASAFLIWILRRNRVGAHFNDVPIYGHDAPADDADVSADGQGFEAFSLAHNVRPEAEVDEVMNQAIQAGATLVKQPQKVFWGGHGGYFKDPDSHLWEVAHNPHFWVGPRDDGV